MAKKIAPLLPATGALLGQFGDRLRLARLKRRLRGKEVAEAAGMSPMTLRSLERGSPGVTIGAYLAVMQVLGLEEELDLLARDDAAPATRMVERREHRALAAGSEQKAAADTIAPSSQDASARDGAEGDRNVERLRRMTDAIPEERWKVLFDWLGQVPAVTRDADANAEAGGGQPQINGAAAPEAPEAEASLHITFDWLDAPASDLRKLVKPGIAESPAARKGAARATPNEVRVDVGDKSRDGKRKHIGENAG